MKNIIQFLNEARKPEFENFKVRLNQLGLTLDGPDSTLMCYIYPNDAKTDSDGNPYPCVGVIIDGHNGGCGWIPFYDYDEEERVNTERLIVTKKDCDIKKIKLTKNKKFDLSPNNSDYYAFSEHNAFLLKDLIK